MENITTYLAEAKDFSDYKVEVVDKFYDIYHDQGLLRFVNAMIKFIEDKHYEKTGWEQKELEKLLPKLKSLKQKPF